MPGKSASSRLAAAAHTVYRVALYLYPARFRREFSAEMTRDFREATEDTRRAGRPLDLLALWARIGADLAATAARQWLRTGLPVLLLCSAAGALAAASVAANVLPREPLAVPAAAHDRDVITLLLLTCTVLLVVVATMLFTFWFSRPFLKRHRR